MLSAAFLAALALAAALLVFAPLRRPLSAAPEDAERESLEEDYHASLAALRELSEAGARGEVDPAAATRETLRWQGRAARTLAALEGLPPAPPRVPRSPVGPALLGLAGVAALVALGAFTVLPRWQLAGLAPDEAAALQSAVQVPALAARAQRSGNVADARAWGRAAFEAGRYLEAARAYAEVLRQNPRDPEALRRVGIVLLQGGEKVQEGAGFVNASAQLDPKSAEGQLFLGFALARLGQNDAALKALERYRSLNPQGRDADDLIASLRAQQGTGNLGEATYRAQGCASCHGVDGRGGVGPSLRGSGLSREAAASVIRNGAAGMPAYHASELPAAKLNALLDMLDQWNAHRGQ